MMALNTIGTDGIRTEYWFSAHETAELAAEVEVKGRDFYRRLAAELDSGTIRNMCEFFADQETEHRASFVGIAEYYRGKTAEFPYPVDIRAMLLASMRDIEAAFSDDAERIVHGGGIVRCLNLARQVEETSVAVYRHMHRTYTERFAPVLSSITAQEEEHLRLVTRVLTLV